MGESIQFNSIIGRGYRLPGRLCAKKSLCLEAMLCTYNKLSLGYKKGECIGIFTIIECLKQEEIANKEGTLFLYHPINFSDMKEYVNFLVAEVA